MALGGCSKGGCAEWMQTRVQEGRAMVEGAGDILRFPSPSNKVEQQSWVETSLLRHSLQVVLDGCSVHVVM
jgi:hypothetical protein